MKGEADIAAATGTQGIKASPSPHLARRRHGIALLALGYLLQFTAFVVVFRGDFITFSLVLIMGVGLTSASAFRWPDLAFPSRDSFAVRLVPMAGFIIVTAVLFYWRDSPRPMLASHCLGLAGSWLVTTNAFFHFRHLRRRLLYTRH